MMAAGGGGGNQAGANPGPPPGLGGGAAAGAAVVGVTAEDEAKSWEQESKRTKELPKLLSLKPKALDVWVKTVSIQLMGVSQALLATFSKALGESEETYALFLATDDLSKWEITATPSTGSPRENALVPLVLKSIPESAERALVQEGKTSLTEVLFHLLVESQGGTLQEELLR